MRVKIVDPSAFSAPYDRCLCAALARAGADVELVTSRFLYGPVPPQDGYRVNEAFYRRSARRGLDAPARRAFKLGEHFADMLRYRHQAADADVVHYQWLTLPGIDWALLPPPAHRNVAGTASGRPPQVFTFHHPPARCPPSSARSNGRSCCASGSSAPTREWTCCCEPSTPSRTPSCGSWACRACRSSPCGRWR